MRGGRKNLKRAAEDNSFTLQKGQSIMQVLALQGSNQIQVMDAKGEHTMAYFPAKFQKSMWIKTGNFVVVDESGREEALESGSKVTCIVSQVLFHEQVRRLQKSPEWPEAFKSKTIDSSTKNVSEPASEVEAEEAGTSDDDGLPPLEANTNRRRPYELHSASNSDADTNSDEES